MDYESRKVKWYWFLAYIFYCSVVVYLLFQGNPLLYSRSELRSVLNVADGSHHLTVPLHPQEVALSPPTFQSRYNMARTSADPLSAPRNKVYQEYQRFPVNFGLENFEVQNVSQDQSGFYLTGKGPWAVALSLDGKPIWKYRFRSPAAQVGLLPILLDEHSAYLIDSMGEVVCVDKANGELRWRISLKQSVVAVPILWRQQIIIPTKSKSGVTLTLLMRINGRIATDLPTLALKPGFLLSESAELNRLIATVENKVVSIDPGEWVIDWSQTLTDPIKGPAVVVGSQIYVSTLGAKVVKLDGSKKGKQEWEADIIKPAAASPAFVPLIQHLAILDSSGSMSAIDTKSGKVLWRLPIESRISMFEVWSARLKGQHIEEYKMDWLHKGWSIWSVCGETHFCVFTPGKGQMINRIRLSGRPIALPLPLDRRWVFLLQPKPGQYLISHVAEEAEIKKLSSENSAVKQD